ncbi:PorP/SprF family type IX secretion system membrane protein [Cyclobacterium marinum]|uniref:Putative membrane protein n=1 Tax=Cyclobacterium marinum (strain ATCC 25205 / DSM 745 / LMG 13164 / NCIMB 1802) TaxID=880070 RepID=G0IVL6_CYCMS|nr:type IX secretion system membrane protein PorP/SprF [Cyclobacterium marinum]AEL24212.1 putative membrane protein [Cyclobacterium marinum DSM 745]
MKPITLHRILLTISVFFSLTATQAQQLPQYSQYVFNPLHINPAYAGYKIDPFVQATYRSQFNGFEGAPQTFSVAADIGNLEQTMGFGIQINSDKFGASDIQNLLLTYSYSVQLSYSSYLSLGVSSGIASYGLDASQYQPDDPSDPGIPQGKISAITPNLNLGIFFHTPQFFTGVSAYNLVGQNILENKNLAVATHNYHFYYQLGALLPLSNAVSLKPSILIREELNGPTSFDINAMFLLRENYWIGTSFRSGLVKNQASISEIGNNRKALALLMDIFITQELRMGYAYDFNLNSKSNYTNNSHELSLGYYINNKWFDSPSQRNF